MALFKKWDQPKLILHVQPPREIYRTLDVLLLLFIHNLPTASKETSTMLGIQRSCSPSKCSAVAIAQGIVDYHL